MKRIPAKTIRFNTLPIGCRLGEELSRRQQVSPLTGEGQGEVGSYFELINGCKVRLVLTTKDMYDPSTLPAVEAVGIYTFSNYMPSSSSKIAEEQQEMLAGVTHFKVRSMEFPVAESMIIRDPEVATIIQLWRQLPEDEQARCHFPAYGLRFVYKGEVILSASLCWQCNNIWIGTTNEETFYAFDGRAPISQQLLANLQEHLPHN